MAKHGEAFARDLGVLFESYIGRQLSLIDEARVWPEVKFGKGDGHKSVDWFVVLPGVVVLVEVKSRRLGPAARAGGAVLMDALRATLDRATEQLARTVHHLADRHVAFDHIPTDRPMLGLIVTAEPFYTGTAHLDLAEKSPIPGGSLPNVPVAVASARDIENLATLGENAERALLASITTGGAALTWHKFNESSSNDNPILLKAWNRYPWPDEQHTRH